MVVGGLRFCPLWSGKGGGVKEDKAQAKSVLE